MLDALVNLVLSIIVFWPVIAVVVIIHALIGPSGPNKR